MREYCNVKKYRKKGLVRQRDGIRKKRMRARQKEHYACRKNMLGKIL